MDVVEKLIEILGDYDLSPQTERKLITAKTTPLADIAGFESDFIPEVVRRLYRELNGEPLPKGTRVKNIFVAGGKKLTVQDIARSFAKTHSKKSLRTSA